MIEVCFLWEIVTLHNLSTCAVFVAPQLKIGENRLTVTGEKGYRMIRATHSELCVRREGVEREEQREREEEVGWWEGGGGEEEEQRGWEKRL